VYQVAGQRVGYGVGINIPRLAPLEQPESFASTTDNRIAKGPSSMRRRKLGINHSYPKFKFSSRKSQASYKRKSAIKTI